MATARRLIFWEFLKASKADLITLLFSSLQNYEGSGDGDSGNSGADPCQFLLFPKTKIWLSAPLFFTFETFGKKLAETKIFARVNVKKIKAKKIEKRLLNCLWWSDNNFLSKFVNSGESRQFFGRCWGFAKMLWVNLSS
jgi:hypothetical protein